MTSTHDTTTPTLSADLRTVIGKQVRQLRSKGQIPAVVYGHGQESLSISVPARELLAVWKSAGSSTLVDLKVDGKAAHKVLIHDLQLDPTTSRLVHADFYTVNMKEKLQTEIPLEFVGESAAVEVEGGSLSTVKAMVNVECLPQDLVHSIEVDISVLATFEDDIRVKDIKAPAGIEILDDEDEMVASVTAPRSEEELAALDEAVEATDVTAIAAETGGEAPAEGEEAAATEEK
ncbi:MAG: 50S ribosomal protein L25 [bacterium]